MARERLFFGGVSQDKKGYYLRHLTRQWQKAGAFYPSISERGVESIWIADMKPEPDNAAKYIAAEMRKKHILSWRVRTPFRQYVLAKIRDVGASRLFSSLKKFLRSEELSGLCQEFPNLQQEHF